MLGSKISIVSPKPQTTRHRILGVHSQPGYQAVFIDTPGLHRNASRAMNRMMNRTASSALTDAEVVIFVSEAHTWKAEDQDVLDRLSDIRSPVIAVLNKVDQVKPKSALLGAIAEMNDRMSFAEIIPLSAWRKENLDSLLDVLPTYLPKSPPLFPVEMITDRSDIFRIGELIREKLTLMLRDELPYGLTVQIERFEIEDDGRAVVHAIIWGRRGGALEQRDGEKQREGRGHAQGYRPQREAGDFAAARPAGAPGTVGQGQEQLGE